MSGKVELEIQGLLHRYENLILKKLDSYQDTPELDLMSWMTQQTPQTLALILGMLSTAYIKYPDALFWRIIRDVEKKQKGVKVIL